MYVLTSRNEVKQFPYSFADLQKDLPSVSFCAPITDAILAEYGVFPVINQAPPPYDEATQDVESDAPSFVDGQWLQSFKVVNLSEAQKEEKAARKSNLVRQERNTKLTESDWTQLPDAPVDKLEWAPYRQALRDISGQTGFPWSLTWPVNP